MSYRILDPARINAEGGMATIDRTARFIKRIGGEEGKAKLGACRFEYSVGGGKIRILIIEDKTPILKASKSEESSNRLDWKVDLGPNPADLRMKLTTWEQQAAVNVFKQSKGIKVS